jgi:Zn-dependent peptidase ImmA (M78 family)
MPHQLTANYTIITANGLTPEEERFVAIKELMHIYFGPDGGGIYATSSEIELENLINELFVGSLTKSKQTAAEAKALWMAMSVLTREKDRREAREAGVTPEKLAALAARWRLPERRASLLFSDRYVREVESLLA